MNKGLTLIETVLYVALLALLVPLIVTVVSLTTDTRVQGENLTVIMQEGSRLVRIISQAVRNADGVNYPVLQSASSTLSLVVADSAKNPTVFYEENGLIYIKEGTTAEVALSNIKSAVSNLMFTNVSQAGTPGAIRIEFTLSNNLVNRNFYATASLSPQ